MDRKDVAACEKHADDLSVIRRAITHLADSAPEFWAMCLEGRPEHLVQDRHGNPRIWNERNLGQRVELSDGHYGVCVYITARNNDGGAFLTREENYGPR